jgi:hypothetical protein
MIEDQNPIISRLQLVNELFDIFTLNYLPGSMPTCFMALDLLMTVTLSIEYNIFASFIALQLCFIHYTHIRAI